MCMAIFSLGGKRVVITGALGLLGREFVRAFQAESATIILIDIPKVTDARETLQAMGAEEGAYYSCDITDSGVLQKVVSDIKNRYGNVDVLINNAAFNPKVEGGKNTGTTFETYPIEQWEQELRVNLTGTMLVCRTIRPLLTSGASIINIASVYGVVAPDQRIYPEGFEKPAVYGASKAGVIALTKHLATLWGKDGIRVNAVVFGGFENQQDAEFVRRYSERVPLGRMARPEEAAGIIIFLASDASSYATGGVFTIDGGWTAW